MKRVFMCEESTLGNEYLYFEFEFWCHSVQVVLRRYDMRSVVPLKYFSSVLIS